MDKFKYKMIKLPHISLGGSLFNKGKDTNDIRIPKLDKAFNEMGKDGWLIVDIYWMEGLALFKRELKH